MPLGHACGQGVDSGAVADVADLRLRADLLGELAQSLLAARDEHAAPACAGEVARERGSDPARAAGDHGHAFVH